MLPQAKPKTLAFLSNAYGEIWNKWRYLYEGEDNKHDESTEQEWSEEIEVISFLSSPEGVKGEWKHHNGCQDRWLENHFPCFNTE